MGEWAIMTLEEAGVQLLDCEHKTPPAAAEGYPYIAIPQIKDGRICPEGARRISENHFIEWTRKTSPQTNDVIITRRGRVGDSAVVPTGLKCAIGQNLVILRANGERVLPEYLRFLVQGREYWSQVHKFLNVGAVFDSLNCRDIPKFEIKVPPLEDQRAIAHVLGTLDDKIELNRRMNETLETMARALFKSWFVDFDPVRAKAEGRDLGLPSDVTDLFPDRFENSELGEIPAGWEVARLGEHVVATRGLSYKGSGLSESGIPLHNLNSVYEGGGYKHDGIKYYTGEYKDRHRLEVGDVIVANTEQGHDRLLIGYAALVPPNHGSDGTFSHHLYRVHPRDESPLKSSYLCYLFNSAQMHRIVSGYANGTTVNMLPADALANPYILIPNESVMKAFHAVVDRVIARRDDIIGENITLARLRETLLPKLISGEMQMQTTLWPNSRYGDERGVDPDHSRCPHSIQ